MTGLGRIVLAAAAMAMVQGAAEAQDTAPDLVRDALAGVLPEVTSLPGIRSDSRRMAPGTMDADGHYSGKGGPELAGAPVEPAIAPEAVPAPLPMDAKGQASADIVMRGGGQGPASQPFQFNMDDKNP
ncbi:hypothetical protein [Maricaulis parjimensis]|uniref:hypothetical protein n=1 Tax=Maricaulis parjimensis TaxID=144023 RepID=UPI00193A0E8E|nr:hypothetical protein [Maricaulis parjimensis]